MEWLFTVTYYLFLIHLVRVTIFWLHLWQIKEYRLDRILIHIRETKQGRAILFGFEPVFKTAILISYIAGIFFPVLYDIVPYAIFGIYAYEAARFGLDLLYRKVKFPVFTPKLIVIALLTTLFVFGLLSIPLLYQYYWLVFVDKLVMFLIMIFMGLMAFPSMFYKDTQINKAIAKLRRHKDVLVIGITGSYGKGSTKEYMYTVLSQKFNTLKTPATFNTPIGIARTILNHLNKSTEVFIVEMGAYKIGEIADMCQFVQPKIGVLTAVNAQHVSLFGSIENTMKAKYELIEHLPVNGKALFNGNNERAYSLYKSTRKRKKYLYYSDIDNANPNKAQIVATNVKVHPTSVTFDAAIDGETYKNLRVNLVGRHHIENILPALFVAKTLGMKKTEIRNALKEIRPLYKTMEPYRGNETGTLYIDDTYNANPASVLSAVDFLSHLRGKKALVLQPMIELGKNGKSDHYEVGKAIGKTCQYLFLTNTNFYKEIKKGIDETGGTCKIIIGSPKYLAGKIIHIFGKADTVVFEGKEAQAVFDLCKHRAIV